MRCGRSGIGNQCSTSAFDVDFRNGQVGEGPPLEKRCVDHVGCHQGAHDHDSQFSGEPPVPVSLFARLEEFRIVQTLLPLKPALTFSEF